MWGALGEDPGTHHGQIEDSTHRSELGGLGDEGTGPDKGADVTGRHKHLDTHTLPLMHLLGLVTWRRGRGEEVRSGGRGDKVRDRQNGVKAVSGGPGQHVRLSGGEKGMRHNVAQRHLALTGADPGTGRQNQFLGPSQH